MLTVSKTISSLYLVGNATVPVKQSLGYKLRKKCMDVPCLTTKCSRPLLIFLFLSFPSWLKHCFNLRFSTGRFWKICLKQEADDHCHSRGGHFKQRGPLLQIEGERSDSQRFLWFWQEWSLPDLQQIQWVRAVDCGPQNRSHQEELATRVEAVHTQYNFDL